MKSIEKVYKKLCADRFHERFELTLSDDKSVVVVKVDDKIIITADDDMIVVARRKSLFGVPYDSVKHTHYADFDDLYQRLRTYLSADAT